MTNLTRRSFLASAASVSALALSAAALPTRPARRAPRTLRKAVMFGMIADGSSLADKFSILKDAGFEGVEMDSPSSTPIPDIQDAAARTGIVVHGLVDSAHWRLHLNSPEPAVRDKAREALDTALRDAKALGALSVLLVPAVVNKAQPYDAAYALSQAELRKSLPLAAACGVKIAVENVWNGFLLSPLEAARYVDELASPWAAFHFDIGNVINFGHPAQWIRVLGRRIVKLHVKDFSRKKRDDLGLWKGFDVELGEGDADWPEVMKALDETGYSTAPAGHWATAEVRGGDAKRLAQVSAQMDTLFKM